MKGSDVRKFRDKLFRIKNKGKNKWNTVKDKLKLQRRLSIKRNR